MKKILFTLSVAIVFFTGAVAQLGTIDPNFNLGTGFGPDQWTGKCETIIQQSDGKLLVGGQFRTFNEDTTFYITRLNLDGTRDLGFTSPFEYGWGYEVSDIVMQSDGKIIIGGVFGEIGGVSQNNIARLHSDGSLDATFDPASGFNQRVNAVAVQPDGKILVGGLFTVFDYVWGGDQISVNGIARLHTDGSLDTTFQIGTGFSGGSGIGQRRIHKIIVQPDGKILIGGHFGNFNGDTTLLLTRLNSDGSIDNTFNANANFSPAIDGYYGQVYSIKLLPNGKIMIGGNYGNTNSLAIGVDRLNADGSLDATFQTTHSTDLRNFALDVQSDGKVLAANVNFGAPSEDFVVERYNTDGSLDAIFPQKYVNNDVKDLIIQMDGNITFVGYFNYNPTGIMRLIGDTPLSIAPTKNPDFNFNIYPNPANNFAILTNLPNGSTVRVLDITGKVVYSSVTTSEQTTTINTTDLINGIYLVRIDNNGKIANRKLVVNK